MLQSARSHNNCLDLDCVYSNSGSSLAVVLGVSRFSAMSLHSPKLHWVQGLTSWLLQGTTPIEAQIWTFVQKSKEHCFLFCFQVDIFWLNLQERTILSDARANLAYHVVQLPISCDSMWFCNNSPRKSFCRFWGHDFLSIQSYMWNKFLSWSLKGIHSNPSLKLRIARTPSTSSSFAEFCYSCTRWVQWASSYK